MTTTKLLDRPIIATPVKAVRSTRRAYLGALGFGYDFAIARAEKRRTQITELFGELITRGEGLEADAKVLFERAKTEARELTVSAVDTVEDVVEAVTDAVEEVTESKLVTKAAPVTARKVAAKPKGVSLDEMSDDLRGYVERVQKYDAMANPAMVAKIVTHLGIALRSRDTKFVACSDEAERKTVAESWLTKKLGVTADAAALDAKVMAVCEMMKADRMKDRVTFYYLIAKNEGLLGKL